MRSPLATDQQRPRSRAGARRSFPYEPAFADYLRSRGVPYVAVDESRKAIFAGQRIKSFDFLVYPGGAAHWIVDVKGRQFPYVGQDRQHRYWENWVTREDLDGLAEWQAVFGEDFEARFVFAYALQGDPSRWPACRPHPYQGRLYAFFAVTLTEYERHSRVRSGRWQTYSVPLGVFREIAFPVEQIAFLDR